jgi:hypothetical protein
MWHIVPHNQTIYWVLMPKAKCSIFPFPHTIFINIGLKVSYNHKVPWALTFKLSSRLDQNHLITKHYHFWICQKKSYDQTLVWPLFWILRKNVLKTSYITKHQKPHSFQLAHPTLQLCALECVSSHPWLNITHVMVGHTTIFYLGSH